MCGGRLRFRPFNLSSMALGRRSAMPGVGRGATGAVRRYAARQAQRRNARKGAMRARPLACTIGDRWFLLSLPPRARSSLARPESAQLGSARLRSARPLPLAGSSFLFFSPTITYSLIRTFHTIHVSLHPLRATSLRRGKSWHLDAYSSEFWLITASIFWKASARLPAKRSSSFVDFRNNRLPDLASGLSSLSWSLSRETPSFSSLSFIPTHSVFQGGILSVGLDF